MKKESGRVLLIILIVLMLSVSVPGQTSCTDSDGGRNSRSSLLKLVDECAHISLIEIGSARFASMNSSARLMRCQAPSGDVRAVVSAFPACCLMTYRTIN